MTAAHLLALPLIWLVRLYQRFVSPALPQSCRFYPSCSSYAVTALTRFGPIKGTGLAAWRLLRCNPWNAGGVDHVPERVHRHAGPDQPVREQPALENEDFTPDQPRPQVRAS